jgi:DnaJ-class molecular chaperone
MPNNYEILGVSDDASESDIKKAYRALSLKWHPDRNNNSEEANSKFQEIGSAYETLIDPEKRNQYDMELKFGGMGGGMPFGHGPGMHEFNDINNIFSAMFGGSFGGMPNVRVFHGGGGPGINIHQMFHQQMRPEPLIKQIQITLEQSFQGCNIGVDIERIVITNNERNSENERLYLNIPQGIDNNETIVLSDRGHCVNGVRGEIRLNVQLVNNTEFRRNGMDLIYNKKITLKEALCGFVFDINHLNGKHFSLNNVNNPTVIKPNFKKVMNGMGMVKDNNTGNMIIEFEIEFPDKLTPEQIASLSEVL